MSSGTAAGQQTPVPQVHAGAPKPMPTEHVTQLQDDLRILVEHLANAAAKRPSSGAAVPTALAPAVQLLVRSPEEIAADPDALGQLYICIGELTRLAAPADVTSIRLTRAFVRGEPDPSLPHNIATEARRLRRWAVVSSSFGLLVFLVTVLLLVHVDRGRRTVQQLQAVRLATDTAMRELDVARTASSGAAGALPECPSLGGGRAGIAATEHSGADAPAICARLQDALFHTRLVYRELRIWNVTSARLAYLSPITWITPAPPLSPDLSLQDWESTELRTSVLMTATTGAVLPMLLGLLGACVYVYREIDDAIRTATLAAREALHGTLRMLLGAILGGLLGALWTSGQVVQLEGVSLSLGAIAFFVGFSVEVVFSLLDALVRSVANRIVKADG